MRTLSKSKLIAFRQCPKRLWLEVHHPELREDSAGTVARYSTGNQVGAVARQVYDPDGQGQLIDIKREGFDGALARSRELLRSAQPIFEAGFSAAGALAFADVLLPLRKKGKTVWRMIEVKSSTSVKDYHREDIAIQTYVAKAAGIPLDTVSLAYLDKTWVYPGNGQYQGLLKEEDLTTTAKELEPAVKEWIAGAQSVADSPVEPAVMTGKHCSDPFECGFLAYCRSQESTAEYPVTWLPRIQSKALKALVDEKLVTDMRDVPDELLNAQQRRVRTHTLSGEPYFDAKGAADALSMHKLPAYFLDFETIKFAVPVWKGTRPNETIPFQFSVHRMGRSGDLKHQSFLDLSGNEPSQQLATALIAACGERGPIFVYSSFEKTRINELASRLPRLRKRLLALVDRLVDLYPIVQQYYYHPSQQGSWSIKEVLPAMVPELSYEDLSGVKDGGMAMEAYVEAIAPNTLPARKAEIERELLQYCALDTEAMVRLWRVLSGRPLKED